NSRPGANTRAPNKTTNLLSRELFPTVAIIIIVSGQKLIFQSALELNRPRISALRNEQGDVFE
ncbi:MAG: hypothetical protein LBC18_01395, partial [Opitutaceae bacterium]|nr:hypothetical protein [Opitutaceae bacterium]